MGNPDELASWGSWRPQTERPTPLILGPGLQPVKKQAWDPEKAQKRRRRANTGVFGGWQDFRSVLESLWWGALRWQVGGDLLTNYLCKSLYLKEIVEQRSSWPMIL